MQRSPHAQSAAAAVGHEAAHAVGPRGRQVPPVEPVVPVVQHLVGLRERARAEQLEHGGVPDAHAAAGDGYPGPDRYPNYDRYMHAGFAEPYGAGFERPANRPQRNAVPVRPEHMDRTELCRYEFGMFSAEASRCNVGVGRSRQL